MCMNCNAMCGKCRPPRLKPFICDECGKATILTRDDCMYILGYWLEISSKDYSEKKADGTSRFTCKFCGADLTEVVKRNCFVRYCLFSHLECGWPCGKWNRERREGEPPCKKQVVARDRTKNVS